MFYVTDAGMRCSACQDGRAEVELRGKRLYLRCPICGRTKDYPVEFVKPGHVTGGWENPRAGRYFCVIPLEDNAEYKKDHDGSFKRYVLRRGLFVREEAFVSLVGGTQERVKIDFLKVKEN